jgi:hypothetical protein
MAVLESTDTRQRAGNLALAGVALCAAPFVVVYGWFALGAILSRLSPSATGGVWILALYAPFGLMARGIFARLAPYVAISVAGLGLALVALWLRPWRRLAQVLCIGAIALIALLPLAWRYRPALSAAPGWRALAITRPGPLAGIVKAAQVAAEERPCSYALLGWQGDRVYYRATCGDTTALMAYAPGQEAAPQGADALPLAWDHAALSTSEALALVRASFVRPAQYEATTRPLLLAGDALASADGRWTALVSQHIYGPQDVLVIEATE